MGVVSPPRASRPPPAQARLPVELGPRASPGEGGPALAPTTGSRVGEAAPAPGFAAGQDGAGEFSVLVMEGPSGTPRGHPVRHGQATLSQWGKWEVGEMMEGLVAPLSPDRAAQPGVLLAPVCVHVSVCDGTPPTGAQDHTDMPIHVHTRANLPPLVFARA